MHKAIEKKCRYVFVDLNRISLDNRYAHHSIQHNDSLKQLMFCSGLQSRKYHQLVVWGVEKAKKENQGAT